MVGQGSHPTAAAPLSVLCACALLGPQTQGHLLGCSCLDGVLGEAAEQVRGCQIPGSTAARGPCPRHLPSMRCVLPPCCNLIGKYNIISLPYSPPSGLLPSFTTSDVSCKKDISVWKHFLTVELSPICCLSVKHYRPLLETCGNS